MKTIFKTNVQNLLHTYFYSFLLSAFSVFAGSCLLAFSSHAEVIGNVDWVTDSYLEGYAWDSEVPVSLALTIQVKKSGSDTPVKTFSVCADQYRADLPAVSGDDGCHSFHISMDWNNLEDGIYQVELYYADTLLGAPVSYTKGNVPEETAKPENETASTEGSTSRQNEQNDSIKSLGTFQLTGYCPCYGCSEGWGRHTSTGKLASSNHTIAVDPRVIPYGSRVMIDGVIYTAEDCGGGVKGNHIDIFYDTHAETRQHGTQYKEVFLVV